LPELQLKMLKLFLEFNSKIQSKLTFFLFICSSKIEKLDAKI